MRTIIIISTFVNKHDECDWNPIYNKKKQQKLSVLSRTTASKNNAKTR